MTNEDIEARRARDLERYHRRTAERRAKGLCLKCGKRPPAPHRSQCEPCAEKRRPADLARHHRRTAERADQGLCPKCGKRPPAPDRTLCEPCGAKRNRASRARDARLRAAGMPRRDPERAKRYERERSRREADERRAAGLCVRCGEALAVEGGPVCEPCAETRRASERARYAKASAEGKLYGGRKVETRRRIGRERSRKRDETRRAAGLCTGCGKHPPADGGASCESCREVRRAAEAGAVRLATGRRAVRHVRRAHDRRRLAVRALRRPRDRALSEQERRPPGGVRQTPRRGPVHRLRRAIARSGPLRALCSPVTRTLGVFPDDAGLRPAVHRRRPRDGGRARPLRLVGGRRAGARLRPSVSRPGRGDHRRPGDHGHRGMGVIPHARAPGRPADILPARAPPPDARAAGAPSARRRWTPARRRQLCVSPLRLSAASHEPKEPGP